MLDRIHAGRVTEFRRVLRTCAIAVSSGRHALVLKVPRGQDPDGLARAFHRHCREKAGRPVRLLTLASIDRHPIRRLAELLGIEGDAVPADSALADLPGAQDRWFERLRAALATDLATDGVSAGPGLLVIEGDPRPWPSLLAFLAFLCPGTSPWRALPSIRPRTDQFAVVTVVEEDPDGQGAMPLPDTVETHSIRPLDADDLRAAADAARELLFDDPRRAPPTGRRGKAPARTARDVDSGIQRLLRDGAFAEALALSADPAAALPPVRLARVRLLAGRAQEALEVLEAAMAAGILDAPALLDAGRLAAALGPADRARPFLDALERDGRADGSARATSRDLLQAEIALARGESAIVEGLAPRIPSAGPQQAAALWNALGTSRFRTGALADARRAFEAVLGNADAPARETARARHNLGLIALREGRLAGAAALLQEAVVEADDLGEAYGGALARRNLAIVLEYQGRYAPALELAVEAADRLSRQERPADLAAALLTMADLLLSFGEWDRALALIADAEHRGASSARIAARCSFQRAECSLLRRDVVPAAAALRDASLRLEQAGLADLARFCVARLAEALLAGGNPAEARAVANRLLDPAPLREDEAVGRALRVIGRIHLLEDAPARAAQPLDRARRVLAGECQREPLALTLLDLAEVSSRLGDGRAAAILAEEARSLLADIVGSVPSAHRAAFRARPGIAEILATGADGAAPPVPLVTPRVAPPPLAVLAARPRLRHLVPRIVGSSAALDRVLVAIERVRDVTVPILLQGESGTGKELFAEALHALSPRSDGPFVRVNAAAFPDTLLLTELFGHERGAFTGAHERRVGRFESAHGGTLFLDEIGDVSEQAQAALLRIIEEQRFNRVGGSRTVSVDVRLVFATNRDLDERMRAGRIRRDFYHRIAGLTIPIPPLRERSTDIPELVETFLGDLAREGRRPVTVQADAMSLLQGHRWPGNIRELRNVLRRAVLLSGGPVLTREALLREAPELARTSRRGDGSLDVFDLVFSRGMSLFDARQQAEIALIREALVRSGGNISAAAALLGMKRPRLSQMVKEYDLKVPATSRVKEGS